MRFAAAAIALALTFSLGACATATTGDTPRAAPPGAVPQRAAPPRAGNAEAFMRPRFTEFLRDDRNLGAFLCGTAYLWTAPTLTPREASEARLESGLSLMAMAFDTFQTTHQGQSGYPGEEAAMDWMMAESRQYYQVMERENHTAGVLARCQRDFG